MNTTHFQLQYFLFFSPVQDLIVCPNNTVYSIRKTHVKVNHSKLSINTNLLFKNAFKSIFLLFDQCFEKGFAAGSLNRAIKLRKGKPATESVTTMPPGRNRRDNNGVKPKLPEKKKEEQL